MKNHRITGTFIYICYFYYRTIRVRLWYRHIRFGTAYRSREVDVKEACTLCGAFYCTNTLQYEDGGTQINTLTCVQAGDKRRLSVGPKHFSYYFFFYFVLFLYIYFFFSCSQQYPFVGSTTRARPVPVRSTVTDPSSIVSQYSQTATVRRVFCERPPRRRCHTRVNPPLCTV